MNTKQGKTYSSFWEVLRRIQEVNLYSNQNSKLKDEQKENIKRKLQDLKKEYFLKCTI